MKFNDMKENNCDKSAFDKTAEAPNFNFIQHSNGSVANDKLNMSICKMAKC